MDSPIKILHLEDVRSDAEVVERELKNGKLNYELLWVSNKKDFQKALNEFPADIILSDHSLPSFTSIQAFKMVKEAGIKVPFILITATISEDFAVSMMKEGLADYLLKDRLQRLPGAILNALEQWRAKKKEQEYHDEVVRNEKKFRAMIENNTDIITLAQPDGTLLYASPSLTNLLGFTKEEYSSRPGFEFIHPDDLPGMREQLSDIMNTPGKSFYRKQRLLHKNGSYRWCDGTVTNMLHDPDIGALVSNFQDITERKIAEDKLELAHQELSLLFNNINEVWFSMDVSTGKLIQISKACETIYGRKSEEFLANSNLWRKVVLPEDAEILESIDLTLSSGKPAISTYRIRHADRSIRWIETKVIPTLDSEGQIIRLDGISRDITESKKAEEALKTSEANLAAVIENTDASIYSIDTKFRYLTFNTVLKNTLQQLYGLDIKVGDKVFEFLKKLDPAEANEWERVYSEAFTGKALQFVKEFQVGDFHSFMSFSINPIWGTTQVIGLSCFARDITQQKLAEAEIISLNESLEKKVKERTAELQESNKELETFSYTVSHDLQSPLRSISGFAKILIDDYNNKLDGRGKDFLNIIMASTRQMSELIKDLLRFSKLGKDPMQKKEINMNELITVVLEEIKMERPDYKAEIKVYDLKPCFCDPGLIRQVWTNLISNAVKYSSRKEKPVVEAGMWEINNESVYYVKDNGAGFDMKYADKLFNVFHRLHNVNEFEGTGVGLATVQRIITRHGGRIWADAKKGEGATFYFTLPRVETSI